MRRISSGNDAGGEGAERLAWEMASWRSIEFRARLEFISNQAVPDPRRAAKLNSVHYIETAAGQRMYESRLTLGDGQQSLSVDYCDGSRSAKLNRIKFAGREFDSVEIKRHTLRGGQGNWYDCPPPLLSFYAGLRPLHEAMKSAERQGRTRWLDRDCDVFLISKASGGLQLDVVYWLDSRTAIPLKLTLYMDAEARARGHPIYVWTATTLDEVQGRHFPLLSEDVYYSTVDPERIEVARKVVVESLTFDRDYPKTTFWPKISPETQVIDQITRKHQRSKVVTDLKQGATVKPSQPSLRADSGGAWSRAWPQVSIGLGLAVLLTAGVLWWRRR